MCRSFVGAFAVLALAAAQAAAQTATQPRQPGQQPYAGGVPAATAGGQAGAAAQLDQPIAACLLLGNQEEIALARFAQEHAKSDDVKEFAKMMDEDHRKAVEKLRQIAPQLASVGENLEAGRNAQGANQNANVQGAGADMFSQVLALQESVAQQCLTLTQRELGEKDGNEFDRCYIGQQMGAHLGMLAKLKGSEQFASPQLKSFIQEATKTVQKHFDKTKEIAKTLESEAVKSAQRSGESRR
jgi:putative membrane protein